MGDARKVINERLVDTFNTLLRLEEAAWAGSRMSDVSMCEVHTLEVIDMFGEPAMGETASRLGVAMATLTSAIDKLERKGYCERRRGEGDRRVVRLRLTRKGKMAVRMHSLFHHRMVAATVEGLTSEQESVLASALTHLNEFIRAGLTDGVAARRV